MPASSGSTLGTVARRFVVSGRVQGVGFRYFVYRHALRLGICGWVRNLRSGAVEAVAEGKQESVQALEEMIRKGPSFSYVLECRADEIQIKGYTTFTIERE